LKCSFEKYRVCVPYLLKLTKLLYKRSRIAIGEVREKNNWNERQKEMTKILSESLMTGRMEERE
jgi:hypothetical protein